MAVKPEKKKGKPVNRTEKFMDAAEQAIKSLGADYDDLGITLETDYRGYTTSFTVRGSKDRTGGVLKTHRYKRSRGQL